MEHQLFSPDGRCSIEWELTDGRLFYRILRDGAIVIDRSPINLRLAERGDMEGLRILSVLEDEIDESYPMPAFKKSICHNACRVQKASLAGGVPVITLELRAYNDGAAFRLTGEEDVPYAVLEETTAFTLPRDIRQIIGMKHIASYEDHYCIIPAQELDQNRLAMPILFEAAEQCWALCAEAAVFGDYGGSSLLGLAASPRTLQLRKAQDKLTPVIGNGPMRTPWRVVMMGTLDDLVESNLLENLNPPSIVSDTSFIKPGMCAWSWMTENDSPSDPVRSREYVDYAAKMGFAYYLADFGWDGAVDIPSLVAYGRERGVGIWLWEHSADIRDARVAEEKMRRWSGWGVAGLKIDFFESDSQERMQQFTMLAETAARYRLMLNFHGCTKPAGEIRTWPHVLTREGVQGAEYLQNFSSCTPMGPDAVHNCMLPFTRNAVGPMDYTPVIYKTYPTGTTDAHQTALTVIFSSYIQHIGENCEVVLQSPFRPFLASMHDAWDETRLLEGFPGNHVTMARRSGKDWWIGGICAGRPRNAHLDFSFLGEGEFEATLYRDDLDDLRPFDVAENAMPPAGPELCREMMECRMRQSLHNHDLHRMKTETMLLCADSRLAIPLAMNGGFVMEAHKK